jgi:hypothetical protein
MPSDIHWSNPFAAGGDEPEIPPPHRPDPGTPITHPLPDEPPTSPLPDVPPPPAPAPG